MCRLFGFRSVIPSQVHSSLVAAENALGTQSNEHPDGWGVAFYVNGSPHITRSPQTALGDQLFHRLSGVVSSQTVLAHVRKATQGHNTVLNCHPFQYGRWVFAHNGDVPEFNRLRPSLLEEVTPRLRRFILGDTDSETIFFIFLTQLERYGPLDRQHSVHDVVASLRRVFRIVCEICETNLDGIRAVAEKKSDAKVPLLTMMVTDGDTMGAVQGGKELFYSTYKNSCSERAHCPNLSAECEAPSKTGFVNHFILSSEPLQGENVWEQLAIGDIVGIDGRMRTMQTHLDHQELPIAG